MIIGYLLIGVICATFSAGVSLILGYGFAMSCLVYVGAGLLGMQLAVVVHMIRCWQGPKDMIVARG